MSFKAFVMISLNRTSLLIIVLLAGCQGAPPLSYETPYDNPRNLPPPGTIIELNETLTFSPGKSRSNIQNGTALGSGRFDHYQPWCQFYLHESKDVMKTTRTIEPDRFTVVSSGRNVDHTSTKPVELTFVSVGVGGPVYSRRLIDGEIGAQSLKTTMRLRSENQPQVRELRCAISDDPWSYNFLSINQIIGALGDVATLKLSTVSQ
jgi:hypothetical protein